MPRLDPDNPLAIEQAAEAASAPSAQARKNIREQQRTIQPPKPDLDAIIPATGETVRSWLLRRVGAVSKHNPAARAADLISLASQRMTDQELEGIARSLRIIDRRGLAHPDLATAGLPLAKAAKNPFGIFRGIGAGLAAVGSGVAKASEAVVNAGEKIVRELGAATDEQVEKDVGLIPEDIRQGVKQVVGEAAQVFGGSAEFVEKMTRPITGPVAQSAGYTAQVIKNTIQDSAALLDPSGTIERAPFPRPPSPAQMLQNAISQSPGENFAVQYGLKRGSTEFKIAAGTTDFVAQWFIFGAPGKIAKGLSLAETLPKGEVGVRGLTKWAFELKAKPVEQLVRETKIGKSMVDDLFLRSRDGNVNRLIEVYPQIDDQVAAEVVAAGSREEVEDVLIHAMHGRILPESRGRLVARLDEIEEEAKTLAAVPDDDAARLYSQIGPSGEQARRSESLLGEHDRIVKTLSQDKGKTVLRELPAPTLKTELMDIVKRSPKVPGEKRSAFSWVVSALDKNWARRSWSKLPHYGLPVKAKDVGRAQIVSWGELLKYSRKEIDEFANQYLAATSKGETFDIFRSMLSGAEHRLPPGVARETLQMVDHPLGFEYAVDDAGRAIDWQHLVQSTPDRLAVAYPQPLYSSQLTDILPTPDPRAILQATMMRARIRDLLLRTAKKGGVKGAAAKVAQRGALDPYIATQHLLSSFTSFVWKPMVLARLGWPVKVVALDEQARLAANDIPSLWFHPFEHLQDARGLLGKRTEKVLVRLKDGSLREEKRVVQYVRTPEEVQMQMGRKIVQQGPVGRVLAHGNKGYGESLQQELLVMHKAEEVAYLARNGKAATKKWLASSTHGQQILEDVQPSLDRMGKTVDDWLDVLDGQIATKGRSPALKDAIATGKIKVGDKTYSLTDNAVAEHFQQTLLRDEAPQAVRDLRQVWMRWDGEKTREFTSTIMNALGSKPTNYLSRAPAFNAFYGRELNYLLSRGIEKNLAEKSAKEWAIRQTNDLLYNLMGKTQFDELHKNLVPFFPAWKEVLKTWAVNVPHAIGGPIIGQMTLAARVKALGDLGQEVGVLKKDPDGQWVLDFGFYKTPLTRLMMFGTLPGLGPGHSAALSQLSKRSKKVEGLLQPFFQYGPETTVGPQWFNRLFVSLTGKAPPWEVLSQQFQQDQWDLTVLRNMQMNAAEIRRIGALPEGDEKRAAAQQLVADAKNKARSEYLTRVATGFFLPAAPIRVFESAEKMDAFRASLEGLPTGERRNAFEDFVSENPNLEFMLLSRSYRVPGAPKAEKGRDDWWRARRQGWVDIYDPKEFAQVLIGFAQYDHARTIADQKIAGAGTTARERLLNINQVLEANLEKRVAQYDLERQNPTWAQAFARIIGDKEPILDVAQQKVVDAHRMLGMLQTALKGQETDVDWKEVKAIKAQLGEIIRDYGIFNDANDVAPGVDRTYAKYFDDVFGKYMDELDVIYSKLDSAKTSEDVSAVMEEARRYRNMQKPQMLDGELMPIPEEVLFRMKSSEERQAARQGWAMSPLEWLTDYQRGETGYKDQPRARDYWDRVNEERLNLRKWASENQVSTSSKAYRDRKAALESWEQQTAVQNGLGEEYGLSKALPFQRLGYLELLPESDLWTKVARTASEVQKQMRARDLRSFNNVAGRYYAGIFLPWMDMIRTVDEEFAGQLEALRGVAPKKLQEGPWYNLYAYLFLTGKTTGI